MNSRTLILTGWKYNDYALAAALTLRKYNSADILGMSKRRLPEYLATVQEYTDIIILGVALTGDTTRLAQALTRLKKARVNVRWISGFDFPEEIGADIRTAMQSFISPSQSITDAVAECFGLDYSDLLPYCDDSSSIGQKYIELIEAASYFYRNYQDEQAYPDVIRHIYQKDAEDKWSESEKMMLEHYRRYGHRELVGKGALITDLQAKINILAEHEHTRVLILGESGTGKETVAIQIHNKSRRAAEPFIAFNCASANPQLLESTFRGYEKGAYTGANEKHAGIFEAANGGTLFLDEIGELPLEAQGLLLRILEEGRFQRMGESAKEIVVDVRVITATNRNLAKMVQEGKFRLDLYQRLSVIQLKCPALREHKEDIQLIADLYRERNNMGRHLTKPQIDALLSYDFPGNVRELYNILERAYIFGITDFRQLISEHKELNAEFFTQSQNEMPDSLEETMRIHIRRVYEKYNKNISKSAEVLGTSRNTVRKYLGI